MVEKTDIKIVLMHFSNLKPLAEFTPPTPKQMIIQHPELSLPPQSPPPPPPQFPFT